MLPFLHGVVKTSAKFVRISRAGENPKLRLVFSLICFRIFQTVRLGFHQATKARRTCFIS